MGWGLAGQVLALIGMIAVSLWGAKHLDAEVRTRARLGTSGVDWTMKKGTSLAYMPLIGALIVGSTFAVRNSDNGEPIALLGFALMIMFLAAHAFTIKRAAR